MAVITSVSELSRALRLRQLPDLFELRLDALDPYVDLVRRQIASLRAPLIITARDPREGGAGNLSIAKRRALLRKFLPNAAYIDVELCSASRMQSVLKQASRIGVKRIISVHDFDGVVSDETMHDWLTRAGAFRPDVFKIVVRTDSPNECSQLVRYVESHGNAPRHIAAMGIGKFGRRSRIDLARRGSALVYAHLGTARVAGQLSLSEARAILAVDRNV